MRTNSFRKSAYNFIGLLFVGRGVQKMMFAKENFDLTNPAVALRIMLGLAFIPHAFFKINGMDGAIGFFTKVGLEPALFFVILAIASELICGIALALNVLTKWMGLAGFAILLIADFAIVSLKGFVWLWNFGGIEYNVIWGLGCLVFAIHAWKEEAKTYGKVSFFFPKA